jgi:beta-lactamase class A
MPTTVGGIVLASLLAAPGLADRALERDLRSALEQAGAARGRASVAVRPVEVGSKLQGASIDGAKRLPLQSVVKLVIAAVVLDQVATGQLTLDRKLRVTADDVAPGPDWMVAAWKDLPRELTVEALLEAAMVRSDSTASNLLLRLAGGPAAVSKRLRAWRIEGIAVRAPYRGQKPGTPHPNLASAEGLSALLVRLQRGELLPAGQWQLLRGWMERTTTGVRRLRAGVPAGTVVADKTGTGGDGVTTNDVGLITLPGGRGNLAVAVLLSDWKLPLADQEALIARLAKIAFDASGSVK